MSISALLLSILSPGCSAPFMGVREPEQVAQQARLGSFVVEGTTASVLSHAPTSAPIQPVAYHEPDRPAPNAPTANTGKKEVNGNEKKELEEKKDKGPHPKQTITLPMAIEMCVNNNFRVLAEAQKVRMAEADLTTSSLIPNPTLFADYQLIPLQHTNIQNQLGPPQWDTLVAFPIDWLLFGKRLAAMQAARLGIEVISANFANVLRAQLAHTVDAFYEVLMDEAYFKLAEKNLDELTELAKLTRELAKTKTVGDMELDRIKLAVHEALLDRHDRELALEIAKARLRPFIGRTAAE